MPCYKRTSCHACSSGTETVLEAEVQFKNEMLAFLTYDEEHHRLALVARPGTIDRVPNAAGLAHLAYAYADLSELVATYERLKAAGIVPVRTINHGPTTSMYYADPDGNQVELQVDNFDTPEECHAWFFRPEFAQNPIGIFSIPRTWSRSSTRAFRLRNCSRSDFSIMRGKSPGERGRAATAPAGIGAGLA